MSRADDRSFLSRLSRRTRRREAPTLISASETTPKPASDDPLLALGLFDADWYLFRYPEIADFGAHAVMHFREFGFLEGRDPSPYVSLNKLFSRDPDARAGTVDVILSQLQAASLEEQEAVLPDDESSFEYLVQQHRLFDEAWYAARNPDLAGAGMRLLQHFVRNGAKELREPGPNFDSELYRATYPHFVERYASAVEHYTRVGARRGYAPVGTPRYQRWIEAFDTLTAEDLQRLRTEAAGSTARVVALHVLDTGACDHIAEIITAWDARLDTAVRVRLLRGAEVTEDAWAVCTAAANGVAGLDTDATLDAALDVPAGTVVLLCGGPLVVRPHGASYLAALLQRLGFEAAYCDHDIIDALGNRAEPRFKPSMSPTFMRHQPYAGSMIAAVVTDGSQATLTGALKKAAAGLVDSAWADILLDRMSGSVVRVPFILFHMLVPSVDEHGCKSANEISTAPAPCGPIQPRVSVIIPTRDRVELLRACLDSLMSDTHYPADRVEYIVVDNDSREHETLEYLTQVAALENVSVVRAPGPFNFSLVCNAGAALARGEILVFLNNDMTVQQRDWLTQLTAQAVQPDVGVVGAQLLFPDGTVQHGGVILGIQGVGAHRLSTADIGPAGAMTTTREMIAVTGACLAMRRSVFERLGGFDPVLRVAFNDVKLCISAHEAGLRNIYIGAPLLFHHESKSRGFDDTTFKRHRNAREAIYVREHHNGVFRDDPFYSPNLSLQNVDRLGHPPRAVRPWRLSPPHKRRVLLLSAHHGVGFGVAVVLQQQAAYLRARGWTVLVGGPRRAREIDYDGCVRIDLWTAEAAASFAVAEGIDVVVAHTDPFFSVARYLGAFPLLYFTDHGEPPPRFFADAEQREGLDWEKRFCAPMARRVFVISETIKANQFRADAVVVRNGNSHLASWSQVWNIRRRDVRARLGLTGQFVVLNVCRFGAKDRIYKGVNHYAEIASDFRFLHPKIAIGTRFILAGRADDDDIAEMRAIGIDVHANLSDEALAELYAAADLYMNFSQWEGYNLGIGQALAMGLDVIASDIAAHREFGVEVSDSSLETCASIARRLATWTEDASCRTPSVDPWATPLATMVGAIEADLAAISSP